MNDYINKWNKIAEYKYISFDIFDTLIKRNVRYPAEIFERVEENYNRKNHDRIKDFKKHRMDAEKAAREGNGDKEISLNQIYDYIDYDEVIREKLKKCEIETEFKYCQPNYPIVGLYEKCIAEGKKVIITSDMYLPVEAMETILGDNGYKDYHKLYLSSDIGLTKVSGKLFEYIIKDLRISKRDIIHIGDSKKSDIIQTALKGIRSIYIRRDANNLVFIRDKKVNSSDIYVFINNHIPLYNHKSEAYRWGYEALGPLILGFCSWIHKSTEKYKVDELYFLARDMNLIVKAYRKLYRDKDKVHYLEVSRKSLRVRYVLKNKCLNSVFDTLNRKRYTIGDVFNELRIDYREINEKLRDYNISIFDFMPKAEEKSKVYHILNELVLKLIGSRDDNTLEYLKQEGLLESNLPAIIDIGWHGSIQNMLEKITEKKMVGLYFGDSQKEGFQKMSSDGYWFSTEDEKSILNKLAIVPILEVMLFPPMGTTIGYRKTENGIIPIYKEKEKTDFQIISNFQDGAMQFIDDYFKFCKDHMKEIFIEAEEATAAYVQLAFKPTLHQANILSELMYEDGKTSKLAYVNQRLYYLFHPFSIFLDYKKAKWKEGYLKKLFPFLINPYWIDVMIKNRKLKFLK